jgi:succinate dehydrogenase / fumarate reductase cytochrome b subunit
MQVLAIPRSSIGRKAIMAVTGVVWIGFVAMHMWGNLHIFQGADSFNHYAEFLREVGYPLFSYGQLLNLLRVVTVTSILLHVWAAYTLYRMARRAHGSNYAMKRVVQANYATRFMRIGGVVLILFLLFHLIQFTWIALPETALTPRMDPYSNVVTAFQNPVIAVTYVVAVSALGLHLYHGVWSMFQTLGLNNRDWDGFFRGLAVIVAIVIPVGFITVPIAVMLGFVTL